MRTFFFVTIPITAALLALGASFATAEDPIFKPDPKVAVAEAAQKCVADKPHCAGGFVEFSTGSISRLENVSPGFAETYSYRISDLESLIIGHSKIADLGLKRIILPGDSDWKECAFKHARQFVANDTAKK